VRHQRAGFDCRIDPTPRGGSADEIPQDLNEKQNFVEGKASQDGQQNVEDVSWQEIQFDNVPTQVPMS